MGVFFSRRCAMAGLLFGLVWGSLPASAASPVQGGAPNAPVPIPAQDTGFVDHVNVTFDLSSDRGRIFYTLNGGDPIPLVSPEYVKNDTLVIKQTTTLRAIGWRLQGGSSPVTVAQYTQRKLTMPTYQLDGKPDFADSVHCTLNASYPGIIPRIRCSEDGTDPTALSPECARPVTITASLTLKAAAFYPGYLHSDPLALAFTKEQPTQAPVADFHSGPFSTKTRIVHLSSATTGASIRYTLDPNVNPADSGTISDSVQLLGGNPGDTVVLRAVAFKAGMAVSPIMTERYDYEPPMEQPVPTQLAGFFYDSAMVRWSAPVGAAIRCVYDAALVPTNTSPLCDSIPLLKTTFVKARAFKAPRPPSPVFSGNYVLKLNAPVASRPSSQYQGNLRVYLRANASHASIYYVTDSTGANVPTTHSPQFTGDSIDIGGADTIYLRTIAVVDTVSSTVATFRYVRRDTLSGVSAPSIDPPGKDFLDTQVVLLHPRTAGSQIYYTLNGSAPTPVPAEHYGGGPLVLYATADVKAIAVVPGKPASDVASEHFVLVPSPPTASFPGGAYPNRVDVALTAKETTDSIYYMLGVQPYNPALAEPLRTGGIISLTSSTRLQAQTVSGSGPDRRVSAIFSADYEIYTFVQTDTLKSGAARNLDTGGYVFTNASGAPVLAKVVILSDSSNAVRGFKSDGLGMSISAIPPGSPLPKIVFSRPAGDPEVLYRLRPDGLVELASSGDSGALSNPGVYFAAVDTSPPIIKIVSQEAHPGDSTVIKLSLQDNVIGVAYAVQSPGLPGGGAVPAYGGDSLITFAIKNAGDVPKSLWFRARAADYGNVTWFPANPADARDSSGRFTVPQAWSKLSSPGGWKTGTAASQWDFIGLPLDSASTLTWGRVRHDNPQASIAAAVWSDTGYTRLGDNDRVPAGKALWLGSTAPVPSLNFSNFLSGASAGDGLYHVTLKPGWNTVANPAWERLYWPVARKDPRYSQSLVKSLFAYDPASDYAFAPSDSLDAWKGYFVYKFGNNDTVITLLNAPPAIPAAKAAAPASRFALSLGFHKAFPLRLGADAQARDGVSIEDEPELPAWNGTAQAWSQRGPARLMTDLVHFDPQGVFRWQVIVSGGAAARGDSSALKVLAGEMPPDFEAWAVAPARRIKMRLTEGAAFPTAEAGADTLTVLAGPAAKLAGLPELRKAVENVGETAWSLRQTRDQLVLQVTLAQGFGVEAELSTLTGQSLGRIRADHPGMGLHVFLLGKGSAKGLGLLRLRVSSPETQRVYVRKILFD